MIVFSSSLLNDFCRMKNREFCNNSMNEMTRFLKEKCFHFLKTLEQFFEEVILNLFECATIKF